MQEDKIPFTLFNCPIKLNPYQYIPYYKLHNNKNEIMSLYIADEVGLGKTIEAGIIIKQKIIENAEEKFLIIAPKFLCEQWKQQLNELFNIKTTVLEKGIIYNTNYNVFVLPLSQIKKFYEQNIENQNSDKIIMKNIIIDEAHYFRNGAKSKRYKYIEKFINNFTTRIFMSATPINNYIRDWENQKDLLGDNFTSKDNVTHSKKCEAFPLNKIREIKTVFVKLNDNEQDFYDTTDKTSEDEFGKTIYRHIGASSLYALNKCYENNGLDFDVEYEEIFDEFNNEIDMNAIRNNIDKLNILENFEKSIFGEAETKLKMLIRIIKKYESTDNKIIIFAHYIETCNCIYDKLKELDMVNIFAIKGKMRIKEQENEKNKFEKAQGKKINILVCSDVCKEGINLQCASILINYDLPFNPAIVEQRIGRIDRVGQKNDIYIYNFVVEGTYDDTVYWEFLLGKLSIINKYAKLDIMNEMNITDKNNFINDFEKSVNNAIAIASKDIEELKYIYNTLRKIIKVPKETNENIKVEILKEKIKEYLGIIINNLKYLNSSEVSNTGKFINDIKQYSIEENIKKHKEKIENISQKIFGNDNLSISIYKFLKEKLGNPIEQNHYKFKVIINPKKVRESFINDYDDRIFLRPAIKNIDEVYGLLEDSQDIIDKSKIEVKEKIEVSFEYLNPELNYSNFNEELDLPEWKCYCDDFVPLFILQKIIGE